MNAYGVKAWCGVFASCLPLVQLLARAVDCRISAGAPLALADQLPVPMTVKRGWSGFSGRRAI